MIRPHFSNAWLGLGKPMPWGRSRQRDASHSPQYNPAAVAFAPAAGRRTLCRCLAQREQLAG
jgi:hypothetical protein